MEKIPTVKEFLSKNIDYVLENDCKDDVETAMIEFAKLHVEAALKKSARNVVCYNYSVDEQSILNSYPLENIKQYETNIGGEVLDNCE